MANNGCSPYTKLPQSRPAAAGVPKGRQTGRKETEDGREKQWGLTVFIFLFGKKCVCGGTFK